LFILDHVLALSYDSCTRDSQGRLIWPQRVALIAMEEVGLQFESPQEAVINSVRRFVSQGGRRPIEECPLRPGLQILRSRNLVASVSQSARTDPISRGPWRASHLAALFESYFDYYFLSLRRRAFLVGPTVGRWTGILYDERTIDCHLLQWVSRELICRAVGYCFVENEEYSYMEVAGGRVVELYSSILMDGGGLNFWSAGNSSPPVPGPWIGGGFLKQRYQFIPGFYDRAYVRGEKSTFACYLYNAFPDCYNETGNYPLSAFRYFYFACGTE